MFHNTSDEYYDFYKEEFEKLAKTRDDVNLGILDCHDKQVWPICYRYYAFGWPTFKYFGTDNKVYLYRYEL